MRLADTPQYKQGAIGQRLVSLLLQGRGYYVIPSYDYTGTDGDKAPRMQAYRDSYVVPDLDVARGGQRAWIEVKTKTIPVFFRATQQERHGIEQRLWRDYEAVQRETGDPVFLFVIEQNSGTILCERMDRLGSLDGELRHLDPGTSTNGYRERMVYWPRSAMRHFGTFDTSFFSVEMHH